MRYIIVVFLIALVTIGAFSKNVRILGGEDADVRTYPFIVSFRRYGSTETFCGGSLISDRHIVTTAQCLINERNGYDGIRAYTGMAPAELNQGSEHEIARVFIHPRFTNRGHPDEMYLHDIAVAKTKIKIEMTEFQNAIELLNRDVDENDNGFILGWGSTTHPQHSYPLRMQKANTTIIPTRENPRYFKYLIHDTQFLAFDRRGVGPCTGDGGDPFIVDGKLAGFVSIIYPCARGLPEIYTKIFYYIDWIGHVMNF